MCSPVWKAAPSTSVMTVGWPPTAGPASIDAAVEDGIDDRSMAERLADADLAAVVEDRQPGRRARAARRAIDLAVGEDRDVALGQRLVVGWLPEDDAVDAAQVRLRGVDDVDRAFQRRPSSRCRAISSGRAPARRARPSARTSREP